MKTTDFDSVKVAKLAARAQLAFYDEMMRQKKEIEINQGNQMSAENDMKLFVVTTVTTVVNTYVVEAKELEHAYDEVTMVNSGHEDDYFEPVYQKFSTESIVDGKKISMKKFHKMLEKMEETGEGSHWMGEQLIRRIDYKDDIDVTTFINERTGV